MALRDVIRKMTKGNRRKAALTLLDIILKSKNAHKLSSEEAKVFLRLWQEDKFTTINGLVFLLDMAVKLEPEKTVNKLNETGFSELAGSIGGV